MICASCGEDRGVIKSVIKNGTLIKGCSFCLPQQLQQGDSAKYFREWQKTEYRKDLLQPNQPGFVKAYGAETAKQYGYTDEDIRRLS